MKTINDIKGEIKAIENTPVSDIKEMKPAKWKRELKRLELLRLLVIYLETNPKEEFIKSEIDRLEVIMNNRAFDPDEFEKLPQKEITRLRNEHETKFEIKKMRQQQKVLKYLFA